MMDLLLFAAFAVFMGFKLYNALGKKDFDEPRPTAKPSNSNVVTFPHGEAEQTPVQDVAFRDVKKEEDYTALEATYGAEVVNRVKEIRDIDPAFTVQHFLAGARYAFEMILAAYSKGDKATLQSLLARDIYKGFSEAIDARSQQGSNEENTLVSVESPTIKNISVQNKTAQIVVEIISEQINLVKNKDGKVIEGDPSEVNKVSEMWTFSRNLTSPNPNWELVATAQS